MSNARRVLVTGAGGFIGSHLVNYLVDHGYWVRGVDLEPPAYHSPAAHEFELADLRSWENCVKATRGVDEVYAAAANAGGLRKETSPAGVVRDNTLLGLHTLEAARVNGVRRFLYTSIARPADPVEACAWGNLYMERICRHYRDDFGLETRVARLTGIFGPRGAFDGGRENLPAAVCRQVALAQNGDAIEVPEDGRAGPYCYIDDCIEGIYRLMRSNCDGPLNIGSDARISVRELIETAALVAGKRIHPRHDLVVPQKAGGRASNLAGLREILGWEPRVPFEEGLARTYGWIQREMERQGRLPVKPVAVDQEAPLAATA